MIPAICLGFCAVVACLLFGRARKESLDHGDVRRINRRMEKLHPGDGSNYE